MFLTIHSAAHSLDNLSDERTRLIYGYSTRNRVSGTEARVYSTDDLDLGPASQTIHVTLQNFQHPPLVFQLGPCPITTASAAKNDNEIAILAHVRLEPPGNGFVFYKVTQPKICNKRTQFLYTPDKLSSEWTSQ